MAKIMVVEDSPDQRDFLTRVLRADGHDVYTAGNGSEAIRALDTEIFDMLLTDIFMPDCDGLELIRSVRAHDRHLPVLAISAGLRQDLFLHVAEMFGADAVMGKDQLPGEIAAAVADLLATRKRRIH
jgi:CheY-like chemotaxis protein